MRRAPNRKVLPLIEEIYKTLLEKEKQGGINAGIQALNDIINSHKTHYNHLIFNLQENS